MESDGVAALGRARPCGRLAGEYDLLASEARRVADHDARARLAFQTVAHGEARARLDGRVELNAAAAGSVPGCRMLLPFKCSALSGQSNTAPSHGRYR